MAILISAQTLGWISLAGAQAFSPTHVPVLPKSLVTVWRALREFDRFLDHHPLMEDQLRLNPMLVSDPAFLTRSPELHDFLRGNPAVTEGLRSYPRYFLNRSLVRQASAPVTFRDLAPLKDLFKGQPKLQEELNNNPELIRDPTYRASHLALRDCLIQHPALARVFITASVPSTSK